MIESTYKDDINELVEEQMSKMQNITEISSLFNLIKFQINKWNTLILRRINLAQRIHANYENIPELAKVTPNEIIIVNNKALSDKFNETLKQFEFLLKQIGKDEEHINNFWQLPVNILQYIKINIYLGNNDRHTSRN